MKIAICNKTCLRGSKTPHEMSLKMCLINRSTPFSVTLLVVISKETGRWLLPKRVQINFKSVKMNLSPTPSETFCNGLGFRNVLRWSQRKNLENS